MSRILSLPAGCCVAVLLLAGCAVTGTSPPPVVPSRSIGAPWPVEASDPALRPSTNGTPAADDCNARASLRPPASLPPPGNMPIGSTMRAIADRGRLIVGTDQNNFPFGYRDPFTGQILGFDVDVARAVAEAIFGSRNDIFVQVVGIAADERIDAIKSGKVDLVADAMTITCGRWEQVAFSNVYFDALQRILVLKNSTITGLADLSGRKVCATTGSTSINTLFVKAPAAHVVSAKYWTDCLVMLQQGQVVAISTDDTILQGLAAQDPTVQLVGEPFNAEPYGLAVSHKTPDLLRFVNGVLRKIATDGTYQQISKKWLEDAAQAMPAPQYRD